MKYDYVNLLLDDCSENELELLYCFCSNLCVAINYRMRKESNNVEEDAGEEE